MAFVDEIHIYACSGKGGDGVVRWLRTKGIARGGPSGGDGGKGGDVVLVGVRDLTALSTFRYQKKFYAQNGESGKDDLRHGANGEDVVLNVPVGTLARVTETGKEYEIATEGERVILFRGGFGGKGNARFKSSTNQNPFEQTSGRDGKGGNIVFELKIIADVGLVGLPNSGKSSLLNVLTNAKSKTGAYPFTTLEPNLGSFHGHVLADIPGLIEGASSGRGLGVKFLKHIERTGFIIHLVSASQDEPLLAYDEVRKELESFGDILSQKKEIVALSKVDLISSEKCTEIENELRRKTGKEVLRISTQSPDILKEFTKRLSKILEQT